MSNLYKRQSCVGALIQANKLMFDINEPTTNCPGGEVIFDPTGQTDVDTLRQMAHQLFLLKKTVLPQSQTNKPTHNI